MQIQGDMTLNCELMTRRMGRDEFRGLDEEGKSRLREAASDWRLLVQFDSDDRLNWLWSDAGMIYFWARQQDIEACNFENTWAILQCG